LKKSPETTTSQPSKPCTIGDFKGVAGKDKDSIQSILAKGNSHCASRIDEARIQGTSSNT